MRFRTLHTSGEKGFGAPKHRQEKGQSALEDGNTDSPEQSVAGGHHGPGEKLLREVYGLLPWIREVACQRLGSEELRTKLPLVFYCFPTHFYKATHEQTGPPPGCKWVQEVPGDGLKTCHLFTVSNPLKTFSITLHLYLSPRPHPTPLRHSEVPSHLPPFTPFKIKAIFSMFL